MQLNSPPNSAADIIKHDIDMSGVSETSSLQWCHN